jgi:AmmeMemoRadiSam system protein A
LELETPWSEPLLYAQPYGVFVTLQIEGKLRGCIGSLGAFKPLYELVWEMAIQAAFFDPRFDPLSPDEFPLLSVEISILTPPLSVKDLTFIEIGRHGLFIENGPHRGLLLPQVAMDLKLDPVGFLEAVSSKAGLRKEAWMDFLSKIHTFETYILKEEQNS